MREAEIQNSIRLELSKRGYFPERINVGRGYLLSTDIFKRVKSLAMRCDKQLYEKLNAMHPFSTGAVPGRSDVDAIRAGKISFIEVKAENGRPRPDQIQFINTVRERYGCNAGLAYSVEDAIEICEGKIPESNKKWFKE